MLWGNPVLGVVGTLLLWWNVVSPGSAGGRYVAALLIHLTVAGLSFIAAVFHGCDDPDVWQALASRSKLR